jgi:hypothetical protein
MFSSYTLHCNALNMQAADAGWSVAAWRSATFHQHQLTSTAMPSFACAGWSTAAPCKRLLLFITQLGYSIALQHIQLSNSLALQLAGC